MNEEGGIVYLFGALLIVAIVLACLWWMSTQGVELMRAICANL